MIKDGLGAEKQSVDAFLMVGQSNMSGRGFMDAVPPIENRDCLMLRMGRWQIMGEPVNPDRGPAAEFAPGVCLATSFADAYQKETGRRTGLIPCADGGTTMAQWMPGEANFDHAVFQTSLAARSAEIKGILWHQGESDCNDASIATYKERFITMITEMRRQIGNPEVPVLMGELSMEIPQNKRWSITETHIRTMNGIFREIAKEIPACKVVSADGLTLNPDGIHFNSVSLREFGLRYYEVYKKL